MVDVGDLYDRHVAAGYDRDSHGLLAGGRSLGLGQLRRHWLPDGPQAVLDLGVGTGEALLVVREHAPQARLHGIDVSARMLDASRAKLPAVRLVRDDAANLRAHHELGSVDVVLVHFLTTYVDVPTLIADAAAVLRPGGWLSLVATTYDAFPLIQSLASAALGAAELRRLNPAPEGAGELVDALERAGLQRVEQETFEADVTFASLGALLEWGRDSGFFTHILDGLPPAVLDDAAGLESLFPLTDSYRATALLARRGARG